MKKISELRKDLTLSNGIVIAKNIAILVKDLRADAINDIKELQKRIKKFEDNNKKYNLVAHGMRDIINYLKFKHQIKDEEIK